MNKQKPKSYSKWFKTNRDNYLFYIILDHANKIRNTIPIGKTRKKAKLELRKIIEFEQLLAIRNTWVGDWKETESSHYFTPRIEMYGNEARIATMYFPSFFRISRLTFPTEEMCKEFIKYFGPKIKKVLL